MKAKRLKLDLKTGLVQLCCVKKQVYDEENQNRRKTGYLDINWDIAAHKPVHYGAWPEGGKFRPDRTWSWTFLGMLESGLTAYGIFLLFGICLHYRRR